jgi:hypothetical protein
MSFRKRLCVVCGGAIDDRVPRTQDYCSDQKCQWKYLVRLRQNWQENLKRERERLMRQARDLRGNTAEVDWIGNPEEFTTVAVPVNTRCLRHLPEKRRRSFCDRLMQLIDQAAVERSSSTSSKNDITMQTKCDVQMKGMDLCSIFSDACAICRGSCCIPGGDTDAYIKVDTLLRYMHQHPELQQHQVLEKYLSCLPKKTYEDSCVYHTEFGCALSRDMRAETCNSFACDGLIEIREHAIDTKSTRFFIAAMKGEDILRSAFVDGKSNPRTTHILLVD